MSGRLQELPVNGIGYLAGFRVQICPEGFSAVLVNLEGGTTHPAASVKLHKLPVGFLVDGIGFDDPMVTGDGLF